MGGRKKYNASAGEPLRWRISEHMGLLKVVEVVMAPPLMTGETFVWEGAASHLVDAYRKARDSGLPIYLSKDGFKLRKPKSGPDPQPNQ